MSSSSARLPGTKAAHEVQLVPRPGEPVTGHPHLGSPPSPVPVRPPAALARPRVGSGTSSTSTRSRSPSRPLRSSCCAACVASAPPTRCTPRRTSTSAIQPLSAGSRSGRCATPRGSASATREAGRICQRKGLPGVPCTIPLGVDTTRFTPGADRPADFGAGPVTVATSAVWLPTRGFTCFSRLSRPMPALKLHVAGDGPVERPDLRARVAALDIADRVRFFGSLEHEDQLPASTRPWTCSPYRPCRARVAGAVRPCRRGGHVLRGARGRQRHRRAP